MSREQHAHEWKYNEAREVLWNNLPKWFVIRFCIYCHELEDCELSPTTTKK